MIKAEVQLAVFVLENLPDQLGKRKQLLAACLDVLPPNSAVRARVSSMLTLLDRHDEMQCELPGLFAEFEQFTRSPKRGHDGKGGR